MSFFLKNKNVVVWEDDGLSPIPPRKNGKGYDVFSDKTFDGLHWKIPPKSSTRIYSGINLKIPPGMKVYICLTENIKKMNLIFDEKKDVEKVEIYGEIYVQLRNTSDKWKIIEEGEIFGKIFFYHEEPNEISLKRKRENEEKTQLKNAEGFKIACKK